MMVKEETMGFENTEYLNDGAWYNCSIAFLRRSLNGSTSANAIQLAVNRRSTDILIPEQLSRKCRATKIDCNAEFNVVCRIDIPLLDQLATTKIRFNDANLFNA